MPHWVGLDVGNYRTAICVVDRDGSPVLEKECETTSEAIIAALKPIQRRTIKAICVEAGTGTHAIRALRNGGYPVRVVHAVRASKFLSLNRNKTDSNDARGLAEMVRVGRLLGTDVHTKSIKAQNIQTLLMMRHHLVRQRIKLEQLVSASLKLNGYTVRLKKSRRSTTEAVAQVATQTGTGLSVEIDIFPLAKIIDHLRSQTMALEKRLRELAKSISACQIMMSVPGVGYLTALTMFSAIDDPRRFTQPADVGAYFGLVPSVHQSGNRITLGRISRAGNKAARTQLVNAATSLLYRCKVDCHLKRWATAMLKRVGSGKARVALARKLAVLLLRLWNKGHFFDKNVGIA